MKIIVSYVFMKLDEVTTNAIIIVEINVVKNIASSSTSFHYFHDGEIMIFFMNFFQSHSLIQA